MSFQINRYPKSSNKSLRAWNAADEYLLEFRAKLGLKGKKPLIYQDRFGYLSTALHADQPIIVCNNYSQEQSIIKNISRNFSEEENIIIKNPLDQLPEKQSPYALMQMPKSLDLFELYLHQLHEGLMDEGVLLVGFMTKYFSKSMLEIAGKYYEQVEQSLAKKKSRVLKLSQKKEKPTLFPIRTISTHLKLEKMQQYYGVFSANHIDYATEFFMEHFSLSSTPKTVLDLASGNGILACFLQEQYPDAAFHLLDDAYLAIASSRLNIQGDQLHYHYRNDLSNFDAEYFDLVVSNPPFHFEHEINIDVALGLFRQVATVMKTGGCFQLVANNHLNYATHLNKIFRKVETIQSNAKFSIYNCHK